MMLLQHQPVTRNPTHLIYRCLFVCTPPFRVDDTAGHVDRRNGGSGSSVTRYGSARHSTQLKTGSDGG
jgi:hypothetical protein